MIQKIEEQSNVKSLPRTAGIKGELNPEINFFLNKILKGVETVFRSFFLVSRWFSKKF